MHVPSAALESCPCTRKAIRDTYHLPLPELLFRAQSIHRAHHDPSAVQVCRLLSIKTGGCPEDCAYCPQSGHYKTSVERQALMDITKGLMQRDKAKAEGATRFCMGAAWREVPRAKNLTPCWRWWRAIAQLDLEVCCTLGMLTEVQARRLKEAGLTAYNHNLDTSPEFYGEIITTRSYQDRLRTIAAVREAGITVCSGGILGMGESTRIESAYWSNWRNLIPTRKAYLSTCWCAVPGNSPAVSKSLTRLIMVRTIATARTMMPTS